MAGESGSQLSWRLLANHSPHYCPVPGAHTVQAGGGQNARNGWYLFRPSFRPAQAIGSGTPQYMAPEQIRDASRVDQRADLFSLGALLYGMICGVPAFRGSDVVTILNRTAAGEYTDPKTIRPDLPDHVASVIRDLLKTNPDERIQSCDLLLERLFPRGVGKTGDDIVALPVEAPAATAPAPVALGDLPTEPGARHVGPVVYDDEVTIPAPPPPPKSNRDPNAPMPAAAVGWLAAAGGVVLLGMGVLVGLVV
jgi:serine/threonine protein kinase